MAKLNAQMLARLQKAGGLVKRGTTKAKQVGLTTKLARTGVTVAGGVAGGALDGVLDGKKTFGAKPSTAVGVAVVAASLAVKGETGEHIAALGAGMLAKSAGQATERAVRKARVNDFLDTLSLPEQDALEERRKSHRNLPQEQRDYIEATKTRKTLDGVRMAGDSASGTQLSAKELEAFARGTS